MVPDALSSLLLSMALAGLGILSAGLIILLWDLSFLLFRKHAKGLR